MYPVPALIYDLVLYDTNESLYLDRLSRDGEWECVLAAHANDEATYERIARQYGWIAEVEYNGEDDGVRNPITGDWAETWCDACKQQAETEH